MANDQLDNIDKTRIQAATRLRTGRRIYKALVQAASPVPPLALLGAWAIDGDGARTSGAGLVGATPLLTEAAAAFAKVFDDSAAAFLNLAVSAGGAGYTANYQMLPDTSALDDAVYFGGTVPFAEMAVDIATAANYTAGVVVWEYWNGSAWVALTIVYDGTGSNNDGTDSFEVDGAIMWIPPSDWVAVAVDSQLAFWVRLRVTTGLTTEPITNSVQHEIVTAAAAWTAPAPAQIVGIRASSGAATLGSTADTKFILMNTTTGTRTDELTWTLSNRSFLFTGLSLAIDTGDVLAVYVTQEDGTAEHSGVIFELQLANADNP